MPVACHEVGDALVVERGSRLVQAVGVADGRGEDVHPGALDEADRDLERLDRPLLVRADAVLDAADALDLPFHVGAVLARLGHDLEALAFVLLDRQLVGVEEDRVPARGQAGADDLAVGAVVEVQRHRARRCWRWSVSHMALRTSRPIERTVLTEVCTMTGLRSSSARPRARPPSSAR